MAASSPRGISSTAAPSPRCCITSGTSRTWPPPRASTYRLDTRTSIIASPRGSLRRAAGGSLGRCRSRDFTSSWRRRTTRPSVRSSTGCAPPSPARTCPFSTTVDYWTAPTLAIASPTSIITTQRQPIGPWPLDSPPTFALRGEHHAPALSDWSRPELPGRAAPRKPRGRWRGSAALRSVGGLRVRGGSDGHGSHALAPRRKPATLGRDRRRGIPAHCPHETSVAPSSQLRLDGLRLPRERHDELRAHGRDLLWRHHAACLGTATGGPGSSPAQIRLWRG